MQLLTILLMFAMFAVVIVLCIGVVFMALGNKLNKKYSNRLMMARVIIQAVAVAIIGLMFLLHR